MRKNIAAIIMGVLFSISAASLTWILMDSWKYAAIPEPHQITDKCEVNGKCYIEAWIEVTPEQYIGLDIGDPYPNE